MRKPRKKHEVVCIDCGDVFETSSHRTQRCPDCREQRENEYKKQYNAKYRMEHGVRPREDSYDEHEVKCKDCGQTFTTKGRRWGCCPDCRKGAAKNPSTRKKKKKTKSLAEVMADLAAYNKQHGTCLSYGEYVVMTNV